MSIKKKLFLFDFDGTITIKDSFILFIKENNSPFQILTSFFLNLYTFLLYFFNKNKYGGKLKISIINTLYRKDIYKFQADARFFGRRKLDNLIKKDFFKILKNNNSRFIIVSASLEDYLLPWAKKHNIDVIATKTMIVNNHIELDGLNCNYAEKLIRIKKEINLSNYSKIFCFGNSKGDFEMFQIADKVYFKNLNFKET